MSFAIKTPSCANSGYSVSVDGKHLYIKDLTGAYDVATNPTGWGTPNYELNKSCVFALAVRKDSVADQLFEGNSSRFVYDPAAANDKITSFDLKFALDGVLNIVIGRLPVSTDGINTIDSTPVAIVSGMYFYYQGDVWKNVSSVNTKVTNYLELVGNVSIVQASAQDALYPMLALHYQDVYKQFTIEEAKKSPDAEDLFSTAEHLYFEMVQVSRLFWCALTVQAQDKIETLLTKYQLSPQF